MFEVLARRASHRRIKQHNLTAATQTTGKLDVFHQRDWGEPANSRKMIAPDKHALVAVDSTESARMPALEFFQFSQPRMTLIKLPIKRAADKSPVVHGRSERFQVGLGQNGIDMMEEQDIACGELCAEVHLYSAAGTFSGAFLDFLMIELWFKQI